MKNQIREISLPNGLTVDFYDLSRAYFGDYHHVRIEIICNIPILPVYFDKREHYDEARSLMGEEVRYRRLEGRMGVPFKDIKKTLDSLIIHFTENSLPYLSSAQFPLKIVHAELKKFKRNIRRPVVPEPQ